MIVWHPVLGNELQFAKSLVRIRHVDEKADLDRVRLQLDLIRETMETWSDEEESPLAYLAKQYRNGLVVSSPLNARIQDPASTLERLYSSLMAPEPYMRASSTRQFARSFASQVNEALTALGRVGIEIDFTEFETFQPVKVTAKYDFDGISHLWRAFSFASLEKTEEQLTSAKAIYAENVDLMALHKYNNAQLGLAVQMPKPAARTDWQSAYDWLARGSARVGLFEDRQSLQHKIPEIVFD
jgi:hypothetical protein